MLIFGIYNFLAFDNPFPIVREYCYSLAVLSLASLLRIYGVLYLSSIRFFVTSFDVEYVIANMVMVTINIK